MASASASGSDAGGGSQNTTLCDGSSDTRFRYEVGGGGLENEGQVVMTENGFNVLVIDGTCHFWTYGSDWASLGVHQGQLSHDQEAQLVNDLHLSSWSQWAGSWPTGACDGPTQLFDFAGNRITLSGGCGDGTGAPFDTVALAKAFDEHLESLKAAAPEVDGGVHIVVYAYDPIQPVPYPPPAWPLSIDPKTIAMSEGAAANLQRGQSRLLASPDDGAKLRAFRAPFLAGAYGGNWYGLELSAVGSDGTRYGIWFRDIMPGEDANGLIHLF